MKWSFKSCESGNINFTLNQEEADCIMYLLLSHIPHRRFCLDLSQRKIFLLLPISVCDHGFIIQQFSLRRKFIQ
jgi:hypothetical protein